MEIIVSKDLNICSLLLSFCALSLILIHVLLGFKSKLFYSFRREACNEGEGDPPLYVNVNMFSGQLMNTWIDSLQAFFPGLQVILL